MSKKKKNTEDESSTEHPGFDTQPMAGPDGKPVKPPLPDMNDPAFTTQIVSTPENSADGSTETDDSRDDQAEASDSPHATQQMDGPDGVPVEPTDPDLNNPAFATQIVAPGSLMDSGVDDSSHDTDTPSAAPGVFATQQMPGPDGNPVVPADPGLNNPAFATQILPPAADPDATDRDIRQQRPSDNDLKRLSQTIAADGGQLADFGDAAKTQPALMLPEAKTVSGLAPTDEEKVPTGRSTWNLRIKQRGIAGYVSGIINEIPDDPSQQTGLQSALISDDSIPEYEVIDELGAGNMGVVYRAKQTSLNRQVAIKSLKPTSKNTDHDQAMFVSEAVVTANLVHPNIVPIHDLGRTDEGKLFYTMKQVSGTPWDETIRTNSLEQNLDIFMKMCDAVAYAHSKGVVNRDLKPENVVVGQYGEVNVLDWGLAITTDAFEQKNSVIVDFRGGGGTPVYMAPELANDDITAIGTHSDIYLLGAILFEVLEGFPPHLLKAAWESENPQAQLQSVIFAVLNNQIEQDVANEGELMEIARKAMRTEPDERWASVEEFQDAIREYRITGRAEELMRQVAEEGATTYSKYQTAVALYDDALLKWPKNERAITGDRKARLAYAELAHAKGDIDLGLQILPAADDPEFVGIRTRLKRTRTARQVVRSTWIALFLAAVGLSGWLVYTNNELLDAENALQVKTELADQATETAEVKTREAELATRKAATATEDAARQKALADTARDVARDLAKRADEARNEVQQLAVTVEQTKKEVEIQTQLASTAKEQAAQRKQEADRARTAAEEQKMLANTAREQADEQKALAEVATKEATAQAKRAEIAKQEAVAQKALAEEQTRLAKAAEQDKIVALREAEKTRIEGRLEQVDAKMEIRKYDDVVKLVDQALIEFESIASQPDLIELLEKKKQEAQRFTGNTSVRLEGKTERATTSVDGTTLVVSTYEDTPSVTVFRSVDRQVPEADSGLILQPQGRTVRDVTVSNRGTVLSVIGRSQTSRNFYHQLWQWDGREYQAIACSETTTRRPPHCLLSADGHHAYLVSSGRTGLVTVYDIADGAAKIVLEQQLDEATLTFPVVHDAVLLPDESAMIVATKEGCRSIAIQWSGENVVITHRKKGQAFNNVFPAPRGLNRLGTGGERDRFDPRQLAISADGSMLALINGTRVIAVPRDRSANSRDFPYVSPEELTGNGVIDTDYGTRVAAGFSMDGSQLVTAGRRYIQVWNKSGGRFQLSRLENLYDGNSIAGHSRSIEHVGFLAGEDGRLVSVSGDSVVRTWNPVAYKDYVEDMNELRDIFRVGARKVLASGNAAIVPAREPVGRAVRPGTRYMLTGAPETSQKALRVRQARRVFSAAFSQDDERIVIGANDLAAHSFESRTASRTASTSMQYPRDAFFAPERNNFLEGHIPEIVSVRFLPPDGDLLLTLDYFGSISVWDAKDDEDGIGFEKSRPLPGSPVVTESTTTPYEVEDPSCEITVSADGQWIMAGGVRNDGHPEIRRSRDTCFVAVWRTADVLRSSSPQPWRVLENEHSTRVTAAAFSPKGTLSVTGGRRGRLVVWDFEQDKVIATKEDAHGSDGISGVFFVSSDEFITAGFDGRVYRWTLKNNQLSDELISRGENIKDPDFIIRLRPNADGSGFITSDLTRSADGRTYNLKLNYWSSKTGWERTLPIGINAPPEDPGESYRHDVSWSPDGSEVLFVHDNRLMILETQTWSVRSGFELPAGNRAIRGTFSPNPDQRARVATFDGRFAHLWDIDQKQHLAEFRSHGPFVRADYSADRRYLITGSESIRVFNANENSPDHGRPVFRLSKQATGRSVFADVKFCSVTGDYRFATVDRLGTVAMWDWQPDIGPPDKPLFSVPGPQDMQAEYSLPNSVCWSTDGRYLAAIQLGQVMLWRLDVNERQRINIAYPRGIAPVDLIMNDLDFSADGSLLTAGGSYEDESYALVWKIAADGAVPVGSIDAEEFHSSYDDTTDGLTGITCIGFDGGRNEILTGGADSRVLRWQIRRPDPGEVIELPYIASMLGGPADDFDAPHNAAVSDLDIASNGSILTADESGYFVVWPASR